ncbi:MAG: LacI family DNA-binding transcriptional regulator [Planctomycetota bacterium]|nr:LacI family DNA-binding transcriptional regulator [Planctomycetota bacterium]
MSSVRAIAKELELSAATVSRVLNGHPDVGRATRERVLAYIDATDYFPKVGRRHANVIALAYPDEPVRTDYGSFEPALLAGIMRGLGEQQFDLKLLSLRRDRVASESYTQFFMRKGVRGVILRCSRRNRSTITQIAAERFPAVVVAEHFDEESVNFVRAESYSSSRRAMEHLIALGHRRIALAIHNVTDSDHADRRRAYNDGLYCAKLPVDPALIFEQPDSLFAGEHVVDAIRMMASPPTAVVATNPITTLGVMRRAQELGLSIPRDLSVVGMDDSDVRTHVWPRLTCVCQDAALLGYEAALWLSRGLADGRKPGTIRRVLGTTFEVNGTTAAAPGHEIGASEAPLPEAAGASETAGAARAPRKARGGKSGVV